MLIVRLPVVGQDLWGSIERIEALELYFDHQGAFNGDALDSRFHFRFDCTRIVARFKVDSQIVLSRIQA